MSSSSIYLDDLYKTKVYIKFVWDMSESSCVSTTILTQTYVNFHLAICLIRSLFLLRFELKTIWSNTN